MSQPQSNEIYSLLIRLSESEVLAIDVHQFILRAPCQCLTTPTGTRDSPLHLAIKLLDPRIAEEVYIVRALAKRVPHAISQQYGNDQKTSIHLLIEKGFDVATIRSFATLKPDALHKQDSYGDTPLHRACYEDGGNLAGAIELARKDPNQLACPNRANYTPAHLLCSERPRELLHFMESVFPSNVPMIQGIHVEELLPRLFCNPNKRDGEYPLHTYLRKGGINSDSTALQLLRWYPTAASIKSKIDGATPLHLASRFHAYSTELLIDLVQQDHHALRDPDKYGRYPIHHLFQFGPHGLASSEACNRNGSVYELRPMEVVKLRVLETFIEHFPESLEISDNDGQFPYDYAKRMASDLARKEPLGEPLRDKVVQILNKVRPCSVKKPCA